MKKPEEILEREVEWERLEEIRQRPGPDLVFVIGRRRIGKSFLLTRFTRQAGGIYYQATRRTEREQLANLSRVIGRHFEDSALNSGVAFPDWESLFSYLVERAAGERFVLTLDEFPYLASSAPALASVLQSIWDHVLPSTRLKLILSGSHVSAMRRLEAMDQPLYGRRTGRVVVRSFDYRDARAFYPNYSDRDRLRAFAIFGGLPGHLAMVDGSRSLELNVAEHLLSPTGRLVDEASHMLDTFVSDSAVPYSIIEAIARGEQTWHGISNRVGRAGGGLHRALGWLEQMEIVSRVVPITERSPQKSKRAIYRIRDPYVAFWHRFISPLVSTGEIETSSGEKLWERAIAPSLDDYMGPSFEQMCRSFTRRGRHLPFSPVRVGEWWDADSRNQVDVVALGEAGELLVGECKWGAVTVEDIRKLQRRMELVRSRLSGIRDVYLALFSGKEQADRALRTALNAARALWFGPKELFR